MTNRITSGPNKSPKILYTCIIRSGKTKINIRPIANTHNKLIIKSFKNRIAHLKKNIYSSTPLQKKHSDSYIEPLFIKYTESFRRFQYCRMTIRWLLRAASSYPTALLYPKPGSMDLARPIGAHHDSSDNPDTPKTAAPDLNVIPRFLLMFRVEFPYTSA